MKMKEASGCLLSFPAPRVPHPNGVGRMCSGGRGVAVVDSDRHGGVISGRNSYGNSRRLLYHGRGTAGN